MSYIQDTLLKNEKLIYWSQPHWVIYFPGVLALIATVLIYFYGPSLFLSNTVIHGFHTYHIVAFVALLLAAYWLIGSYITHQTSEYGITNRRVLMKMGWIRRNSLEIYLEKIEAVNVYQSVLGRLLNYGTITVIGTGGTSDPFFYVPQPLGFHRIIQRQMAEAEGIK